MRVEVVYALADGQEVVGLELAEGATAGDAVAASGLAGRLGLAAASLTLGISGVRVKPATPLRNGDRVEILRPLARDPKDARRLRAKRSRV